jgi:hypothetical protein
MHRQRERHPDERIRDYTRFLVSYASKYWKAGHLNCYVPEEKEPDGEFLNMTVGIVHGMPDILRGLMAATGKTVILAQKPDDIGCGSRTPDEDDYYKRAPAEVGGFYSPGAGLVVVLAEEFNRASGAYKKVSDPHIVFMHEIFHAFDDITGLSELPEFRDAWRLDVLLGLHKLRDYGYLLQEKNGRGRRETIAESGCKMMMGSCRAGPVDRDFPYSYAFTKTFYEVVDREFDQDRDWSWDDENRIGTIRPEFLRDCARAAEKEMLSDYMREHEFYDMVSWGSDRDDDWQTNHLRSDAEREKRRLFRDVIRRQGPDETRAAFLAHRQKLKAMGPLGLG